MTRPAHVWGLPLTPLTRCQAVDRVDELIRAGKPSFFITANTHYAMLTAEVAGLAAINQRAAFILADGVPLVVASRQTAHPVPERVAGSDLIYDLCERAAERGHGVYLLGGPPGIAEEAARRLVARYPALRIVGTVCPDATDLLGPGIDDLIARIKAVQPDLLFVALGQPKGEFWLAKHLEALGVPVAAQVGATLEFVAGKVQRAPKALQKTGMEWAFRIYTDPRRLGPRYWKNARFLARQILRDRFRRDPGTPAEPVAAEITGPTGDAVRGTT